jgi:hypothetical protein
MKKLLLVLLVLPFIGFGQNVNIPDANFKAYLLGNSLINTNGDTEIQVSEAAAFSGSISCGAMNISNLTGIEAFTSLTYLGCVGNQLSSLNVSQNTALTGLSCGNNQLYNLDVSQNTALTMLFCGGNQLTSLNLSQNTALTQLGCDGNQLTSLGVRNGNNTNFVNFNATGNPNLYCIDVDDATWSTANWTGGWPFGFDPQHYFSNNCSVVTPSWNCNNGVCSDPGTGQGAYTSLTACQTVCGTTEIQEQTTNKELLKITDLLGRETKAINQLLFYIYNDGTVEKKVVIE